MVVGSCENRNQHLPFEDDSYRVSALSRLTVAGGCGGNTDLGPKAERERRF